MEQGIPRSIKRVLALRETSLVAVLVVVVAIASFAQPRFLSLDNLRGSVFIVAAIVAIVAVGETFVVLTKNIDLSIASIIGVSAYAVAVMVRENPGLGITMSLVLGTGIGLILGAVNGALVVWGRVPAIVATLGTLFIFRGFSSLLSGTWGPVTANQLPQDYIQFPSQLILGVPLIVWVAAVVIVVAAYILRRTRVGRGVYAVGSNSVGASMVGMSVGKTVFSAFLVSGALSGLIGVFWSMRFAGASSNSAYGYELVVIAAVVVGGVAIFGGRGTVIGATIGALLLVTVQNSLNLLNISPYWLSAIYGLTIIVAISSDALLARRLNRRAASRKDKL